MLALDILRESKMEKIEEFFSLYELNRARIDSFDAKVKRRFDAKQLGREPDPDLVEIR